jgi:hypothetical protein
MTIALLERAADALGPLRGEVAFVGGATVGLWITDPAAPAPRPTKDVDVVVEITTRAGFEEFEARLRRRGFREDVDSGVMCRWRHDDDRENDDLILDAMPARAELLGFANRWQAAALPHVRPVALPSGTAIRVVSPPYLMATKLEAFRGRGGGDHLGSRDLEDIVLLVDGRASLVDEVTAASSDLRGYLAAGIGGLLDESRFVDAVFAFLRPDAASQARGESIVLPRLRAIAGTD